MPSQPAPEPRTAAAVAPEQRARAGRSAFSLLEMMVTMMILTFAVAITADVLTKGVAASQTLDVGADLQERADYFTSLIALKVRGTSSAGNGTSNTSVATPSTATVNVPANSLVFTPSTNFTASGTTYGATYGTTVSLQVTYPAATATPNTGTLFTNDLGWGQTNWTIGNYNASPTEVLCNDVARSWTGPTLDKFGLVLYASDNSTIDSSQVITLPVNGVGGTNSGLGFFAMRSYDSAGLPTLLVIGLCLEYVLPNGEVLDRSSVREVHLSQ